MLIVKAKVRAGRLIVDEPTDLPEGQEITLAPVIDHDHDELDDESRAALHASLARAADDLAQGRLLDGERVFADLRARARR